MKAGKEKSSAEKALSARKRNKVISSIIMIVLGVVLLIWPNQALGIVCQIVGAVLCIGGIVAVIMYFVNKEKNFTLTMTMAVGVIIAFLGFWIFLNPVVLANLIPAIIGAFVIITGIINIGEAMTIHNEHGSGTVGAIIVAAVTIALGLLIFFRPAWSNSVLIRLIGIVLLFDGVSDIWVISRISGTVKEVVSDLKAPDGKATDENGGHVFAKAYAPDDSPEAKAAQKAPATVEDAEYTAAPENFKETHSYTTTTVKRPLHPHETQSESEDAKRTSEEPKEQTEETVKDTTESEPSDENKEE